MTPPENTGGEMPNFDEMSPEEAMAWLESLAKRQGARVDELTTAADLNIPEMPPDTVVDEPGYTPFDAASTGEPAAETRAEPEPEPEPEAEAEVVEVDEADLEWLTEVASEATTPMEAVAEAGEDDQMMADPMAWLESLARRQGVSDAELTTAADLDIPEPAFDTVIDEPGYTPFEPGGRAEVEEVEPEPAAPPEMAAEAAPEPAAEPEPAAPAMAEAGLDAQILADPMAWLESLARRQGVSDAELTTAANLDIPSPPPDTVIDEPGYTPYDPFGREREPVAEEAEAAREAAPLPEPKPEWEEELPAAEPLPADFAAELEVEFEAEFEAEPEAGFEAEIAAEAEGEPEVPPEFELEPTMMPAWLRAVESSRPPEPPEMEALEAEAEALIPQEEEDALAWLESLAAEQGADMAEFLVDTDAMPPVAPEFDEVGLEEAEALQDTVPASLLDWEEEAAPEDITLSQAMAAFAEDTVLSPPVGAEAEIEAGDDPLAGLSDEDIETLMASGQLTREQQQAWLDRQAESLIAHRMSAEEEGEEELPPAVPGELPDWLAEQMPADFAKPSAEPPPLSEEIVSPPAPADLPEWLGSLAEEAAAEAEAEPEGEAAPLPAAWLKSLADEVEAEAPAFAPPEEAAAPLPEPEAEALPAGQPTALPDWAAAYAEAVEEELAEVEPAVDEALGWLAGVQEEVEAEAPLEPAMAAEDTSLDWLLGMEEEVAEAEIEAEDIAAWLREQEEAPLAAPPAEAEVAPAAPPAVEEPVPEVAEEAPPAVEEPVAEAVEEAPPAPPVEEAIPVAPPPTPTPAAPPARAPLERASAETVAEWFARARQLKEAQEFERSLEEYERLVRAEQRLDEVAGDLETIAEALPAHVRVRRLLGDVYMRQNRLQAALDTYRSALDQL